MKFQIGDIACYNDPLFDEGTFVSSYFIVSDIVDDERYYMLPLNAYGNENGEIEDYLITWINSSPKWKKVTE
jgi:hypothetical protein